MKAIVVSAPGGPEVLEVREVSDPTPRDSEVLIDVRVTALNRADLLQRKGLYPPPPGASEILGLECAGVVAAVGAGSTARVGDRVMALLAGGGYAERVAVHEKHTLPIPDDMSFEQAGAIPEAFLTAQEALVTLGRVRPGDFVLIHAAAGGVGSAAVQIACGLGATVIATAGGPEKGKFATELGASQIIDYKQTDFAAGVLDFTRGRGADVILDFVGATYAEKHQRCLATGGRHIVVGHLSGAKATLDLSKLIVRRQSILGLVMRSRSLDDKAAIVDTFRQRFLSWFSEGKLRALVDSVFPLEEVRAAHEKMEQNENLGKIVLKIS